MERETGIEPATSSLGSLHSSYPIDSKGTYLLNILHIKRKFGTF
jgi:hypothetical protein